MDRAIPLVPARGAHRVRLRLRWTSLLSLLVALVLGAGIAWTIPQAILTRQRLAEVTALEGRLSGAQSDATRASGLLASIQGDLTAAQQRRDRLLATSERNATEIRALEQRIAELEAAAAARAAEPQLPVFAPPQCHVETYVHHYEFGLPIIGVRLICT